MAGNEDRDWIGGHRPAHGSCRTTRALGDGLITQALAWRDPTNGRPDALPIYGARRSERQGHGPDLSVEIGVQPEFGTEEEWHRVLIAAPAPVDGHDGIRF